MATKATTAVALPVLSAADLTGMLRQAGLIEPEWASGVNRVKMDGYTFTFGEDDIRISNPKPGSPPAFRARLLDTPIEYQAAWIDEALATAIDRPNAAKSFCKSYFADPNQGRKFAEDGTSCTNCPIGPFVKKSELPHAAGGRKCQWKGDVAFQLLDDNNEISDPTVWTLTMSTTGIMEFKGTGKEPEKGSATDKSFMFKLAEYGATLDEQNPTAGVAKALSSLRIGGVLAECRSVPDQNEDGSIRWNVPVWTPFTIIDVDQAPTLTAGNDLATNGDDLPF